MYEKWLHLRGVSQKFETKICTFTVVNVREELYKPFTYKNWEGEFFHPKFRCLHFVNDLIDQSGRGRINVCKTRQYRQMYVIVRRTRILGATKRASDLTPKLFCV